MTNLPSITPGSALSLAGGGGRLSRAERRAARSVSKTRLAGEIVKAEEAVKINVIREVTEEALLAASERSRRWRWCWCSGPRTRSVGCRISPTRALRRWATSSTRSGGDCDAPAYQHGAAAPSRCRRPDRSSGLLAGSRVARAVGSASRNRERSLGSGRGGAVSAGDAGGRAGGRRCRCVRAAGSRSPSPRRPSHGAHQ